jgi:hypothetical protein
VILGPTAGKITVANEKPAWFPERVGLALMLTPGSYAVDSDSEENRTSFDVPVFTRYFVVPARTDHCLVVASALDAYVFDGEAPPRDAFRIIEREAPSYAGSLIVDRVVTDPCQLPYLVEGVKDIHILCASAVRGGGAPSTDEDASDLLLAALATCGPQ